MHEPCYRSPNSAVINNKQNEQSPDPTPLFQDQRLYLIFGVTLIAVMGVSSISPAFPDIVDALQINSSQVGQLITAFTLPGIVLTPLLGFLADRYGRKIILVPSLLLFGVGGTACAFTTDFQLLLLLRFVQGVGGASLGVMNVTLIGDFYSGYRRAEAMGYNGAVLSIGTASYPAIGGALAELSWQAPFLLSLLALPVGLGVIFMLNQQSAGNSADLKTYVSQLMKYVLKPTSIGLFLANFLTFIILYGTYLTYLPLYLDEVFELRTLYIGFFLSGSSLMTALMSSSLGALSRRFMQRSLIIAGSLGYIAVFTLLPLAQSLWFLILPILLYGVCQGINLPSVMNKLTGQAPQEYRAAFLSVNWSVLRSGQAIGPLLAGLLYGMVQFNGLFYLTAALGGLLALNAFLLIRE